MAFTKGGSIKLFPLAFIKECVETYTKEHGKAPKLLVLAEDDYIDYQLSCTLAQAGTLGLQVTHGSYLRSGEIDLAMGLKPQKKRRHEIQSQRSRSD